VNRASASAVSDTDEGRRAPSDTLALVLLSDRDIRARLDSGELAIDPLDPTMVQPASVDVRLDRGFRLFDNHKYPFIDPAEDQPELTRLVEVGDDEPFILHPGEFVLGATYERVTLPDDVAARLEGKSSLGRLGLLTHSTAGFIDPGFSGHVTLELSNVSTLPIKLWPGMKIGQVCYFQLSSPAESPYGQGANLNRYQGQRGPTASRSFQSFHRTRIDAPEIE
jgi:dCTP deaminase